jgi:hypothetical protein
VVNYLGTELAESTLSYLWDAVALTDKEERAIEALRIVEPRIERIAFLGEPSRRSVRNVFVKLADSERRLPLGSVGDGLRHLLALVLHLLPARGGFLLVDEIDTGLHHSVMADMWRLVIESAKRLDIQVFGTTHSLDCVRALAWVRERHPKLADEATVHRVDLNAGRTTAYSLDEIAVAARNHLEIR